MSEKHVTLWHYRDLRDALLAQSKLDSAGIESVLMDNAMSSILNALGPKTNIALQVTIEEREDALAILREVFPEEKTLSAEQQFTRPRVFIATSNKGKLKDYKAISCEFDIEIEAVHNFKDLPTVEEDGATFVANASKKAEAYSRYAPGEIVLADDSGLEVAALDGQPGVISARYAAVGDENASDAENNYKVIYELSQLPDADRSARFVCVIAAARDGKTLATFEGEVRGEILQMPLGHHGFGYDPLFYYPPENKTFGEMTAEEKAAVSHRGEAFRKFLEWMS